MIENLVIVESPAKSKTIEKYLGKDYKVTSCFGHIRDLPKGENAIDKENKFLPTYIISPDKTKVISELKKLKKKSKKVLIATDSDREGEAIAWHIKEVLNLKKDEFERIVFREITKKAIQNSIKNPTKINMDLVNAQQARRVLDRLVGFEISPILWKKIKTGLSAGRVQSVAVKFVSERENEINDFNSTSIQKIKGIFNLKNERLESELEERLKSKNEALEFLNKCKTSLFKVESLEKKPSKRSPSAPFTTSTLQQESSRKLGFSPSRTMGSAQKLYEAGHITYMRTDSINLSEEALKNSENIIKIKFGEIYSNKKNYKTKNSSAQEAHEAIRPTNFDDEIAGKNSDQQKLYTLIWKRTIASQMSDAKIERTIAKINVSKSDKKFKSSGEIVKFDGFLKVYSESKNNEILLPRMTVNQNINLDYIKSKEIFTKHPPRYTEASLIKKMEESGIGRPSTYAETIKKIKERGYVMKESRDGNKIKSSEIILKNNEIKEEIVEENTGFEKNKLFPTDIGIFVTEFLENNFKLSFMDYSFTAKTEKELDEIAYEKKDWSQMISNFYSSFSKLTNNIPEPRHPVERYLGEYEGKKIYARMARYGAVIQQGDKDDEEVDFPKYNKISENKLIIHISLEEAINIIKKGNELPPNLPESDKINDKKMALKKGRYGFYFQINEKENISLNKIPIEKILNPVVKPEDISKENLNSILKWIQSNPIGPKKCNDGIEIREGKYGKPPFIMIGKDSDIRKNFKKPFLSIPKEVIEKYKYFREIPCEIVEEIIKNNLNK